MGKKVFVGNDEFHFFLNVILGYEDFSIFFMLATKDAYSIDFWHHKEILRIESCPPSFYDFGNGLPSCVNIVFWWFIFGRA